MCAREIDIQGDYIDLLRSYFARRIERFDLLELFDLSRLLNLKSIHDRSVRRLAGSNAKTLVELLRLGSFDKLTLSGVYAFVKIFKTHEHDSVDNSQLRRLLTNRVIDWMLANSKQFECYSPAECRALVVRILGKLVDREQVTIASYSSSMSPSMSSSFVGDILEQVLRLFRKYAK